jgi:hypothetical protein
MVVITVIREKTGTTFNKAVSLVKTHDNNRYPRILILRSRSLFREHGQWPVAWWRQWSVERRPPEMDTYHIPYKKVGTHTGRIIICHQQHNKLSDMTPRGACAVSTRNTYHSQHAAVVPTIHNTRKSGFSGRSLQAYYLTELFQLQGAIASKGVGKTSRQGFGGCPLWAIHIRNWPWVTLWKQSRCVNHQINNTYSVENNIDLFKIELRLYMNATCFGKVKS